LRKRIFLFIALTFTSAGCSVASNPSPFTPVPSPSLAIADATRAPATPTLSASGAITLTLWTTADFAPGASAPGTIWRDQFAVFRSANPSVGLEYVLKKPDGKGGMLDSLLTTRAVVPALLPDIAIINVNDIPLAAEKKIFQPLDGTISADLKDDRFPFAAQWATNQNQWIALPFAADVQHLAFNQAAISPAPKTWDDLGRQKTTLLLPLGGDEAFLVQYTSFGASLNNFDPLVATQVFAFIKRGHDLNFLPETALNAKSADDAWDAFAQGQVAMAQVGASRYWSERDKLSENLNASFAPIPTRDGKIATLATGWAFVIVTSDPVRQRAAARWIEWMLKAERLAPYLRAAHRLPVTRGLIAQTVEPKEYAAFLRELLERALPMPNVPAKQAEAWRAASAAVWSGLTTPENAARNVAGVK